MCGICCFRDRRDRCRQEFRPWRPLRVLIFAACREVFSFSVPWVPSVLPPGASMSYMLSFVPYGRVQRDPEPVYLRQGQDQMLSGTGGRIRNAVAFELRASLPRVWRGGAQAGGCGSGS